MASHNRHKKGLFGKLPLDVVKLIQKEHRNWRLKHQSFTAEILDKGKLGEDAQKIFQKPIDLIENAFKIFYPSRVTDVSKFKDCGLYTKKDVLDWMVQRVIAEKPPGFQMQHPLYLKDGFKFAIHPFKKNDKTPVSQDCVILSYYSMGRSKSFRESGKFGMDQSEVELHEEKINVEVDEKGAHFVREGRKFYTSADFLEFLVTELHDERLKEYLKFHGKKA